VGTGADVPRETSAALTALARWARLTIDEEMVARLERFSRWLAEEAAPAGGLGPGEPARLWDRHLLDSLTFAGPRVGEPATIGDVGSGVGLPGIPLAIVFPEAAVTLIDRSGRRAALARRAVRILGLPNVAVVEAEVRRVRERFDLVTMRAVAVPARAGRWGRRLLRPEGVLVVGGSRREPPPAEVPAGEIITVPPGMLDSPAWLLRIRGTNRDERCP